MFNTIGVTIKKDIKRENYHGMENRRSFVRRGLYGGERRFDRRPHGRKYERPRNERRPAVRGGRTQQENKRHVCQAGGQGCQCTEAGQILFHLLVHDKIILLVCVVYPVSKMT